MGYKVHLSKTCDQNPGRPCLIVNVHTTQAPEHDSQAIEEIQEQVRKQGLAPQQQYVDQEDASGFTDRVINRALQ